MKRAICNIASATPLIVSLIISGCDSPAQDDNDSYERIYFAKQIAETLQKESDTLVYSGVSVENWEKFRISAEKRIRKNEYLIDELKTRIRKSGKQSDLIFEKKTYILEQKNKNLMNRIITYPEVQSDWNSFITEITGELNDMSVELKEMGYTPKTNY